MEIKTEDNLQEAFAGECKANHRYLLFAEKADEDGFPQVARLFRAAAEAETVHARNHLGVLGEIKSTRENLEAASEGENHEFTQMYPGFIEQAKSENNAPADRSFTLANKVEKIHHGLFQKAIISLESGLKEEPYFVCQVCGNTVEGEALEVCPICGAPRSQFKLVD